jgi:hypothetical protein
MDATSGIIKVLGVMFFLGGGAQLLCADDGKTDLPGGESAPATQGEPVGWVEGLSEPGAGHERLDVLVGRWKAKISIWETPSSEETIVTARIERDWVLDGRYLRESFSSTEESGGFSGLSFIGYNNLEGRYEIVWMDNDSTSLYQEAGRFDPVRKVLSTRGVARDADSGFVIFNRTELDMTESDRHEIVVFSTDESGIEHKKLEGVFIREQ